MPTVRGIAVRAVSLACATLTQLVRIVSVDPFDVSPADLGDQTFQSVGINDTELFKQVLLESFPQTPPPKIAEAILRMNLNPSVKIGLVINAVFVIISDPNA